MTKQHKKPEIKPLQPPVVPSPLPEIVPEPNKNRPEHPLPEIVPFSTPEVKPVKKQ